VQETYTFSSIISQNERMREVFRQVKLVAATDVTALILGETGTGKELIAKAIHFNSPRKGRPFVVVNCSALPETLLESELFGHVAGAFTGATVDRQGKFLQADGGTIFLDEIATATPAMQVKLLRVLQELEFEPVGGSKTYHVDTRVILASNEDLSKLVAEGRFRQDLFYRINVINIELPPMRERISDIPLLAQHFLEEVCQEAGRPLKEFTPEVIAALQRYSWPGNVRELQNAIERAVLLGKSDRICLEDLPRQIAAVGPLSVEPIGSRTLKEALSAPERQIILEVLESNQWNRFATADVLGINRTTLYKKMKRLGLEERRHTAKMD
jgi:transcriptional regulator with PAS, ATPase and Fis domain